MTSIRELLAPVKTRAEAATAGPWSDLDAQIRHTQIDGWTDPKGRAAAQKQTAADISFVKNARTDVPHLIQALEAVAGMHKPVTYWMTHEDADISYQTKEDALEDRTDLVESDLIPFELCTHCKVIEDSPCEGECTLEDGYRESPWPCATVRAMVAALGGEA